MKLLSFSTKERLIMFITIPPVSVILNYFLFKKEYFRSAGSFASATIVTMLVVAVVYLSCGMVANIMLNRFPKYSQTFKRIGFSLGIYVLLMFTGVTVIFVGYDYFDFLGYDMNWNSYAWALVIGVSFNLIATSMNEGAGFFEKWQKVMEEAEDLKKTNLQSQLEGLKGQVKPHFLFNSLNALSSLIGEDPDKAEKFLDEMSKVYRYMLRTNDEGLISLEAELQFIQSYYHMLKTRYGDGLEMETRVEERFFCYQVPPHTLQMLVENAVKHNIMMKESPLRILIMTTNSGKLIVTNNLQKKTSKVLSNRVGLTNISNKYKLMNEEEIVVNDDGREFSVIIPLIRP